MSRTISKLQALVGVALLTAVSAASPAVAHHAVNAQFDPDRELVMTGVLKQFDNRAPHCFWSLIDTKTKQEWKFESVSPATLRRAGIKLKEDIKVGTSYTVWYSPSRDGSHIGNLHEIQINGKRMNIMESYVPTTN